MKRAWPSFTALLFFYKQSANGWLLIAPLIYGLQLITGVYQNPGKCCLQSRPIPCLTPFPAWRWNILVPLSTHGNRSMEMPWAFFNGGICVLCVIIDRILPYSLVSSAQISAMMKYIQSNECLEVMSGFSVISCRLIKYIDLCPLLISLRYWNERAYITVSSTLVHVHFPVIVRLLLWYREALILGALVASAWWASLRGDPHF